MVRLRASTFTPRAIASDAGALELRRHAALQWLSGGHLVEGLATLRSVLAAVGLSLRRHPQPSAQRPP